MVVHEYCTVMAFQNYNFFFFSIWKLTHKTHPKQTLNIEQCRNSSYTLCVCTFYLRSHHFCKYHLCSADDQIKTNLFTKFPVCYLNLDFFSRNTGTTSGGLYLLKLKKKTTKHNYSGMLLLSNSILFTLYGPLVDYTFTIYNNVIFISLTFY